MHIAGMSVPSPFKILSLYGRVISLIDPKASWTSKWLRLGTSSKQFTKFFITSYVPGQSKPGCYALGTHSLKSAKI